MAETNSFSHFFVPNSPSTMTQSVAQGFGPLSTNNAIFNITNKFSFSAKTKAFAICKGCFVLFCAPYFPIQKLAKILPNNSSLVTSPVMFPK